MKLKRTAALILILTFVNFTAANIHGDRNDNSPTRTAKELVAPKNILIFELSEEELQVTEILHLLNSSDSVIDFKENPLLKKLPSSAFNIRYLGHGGGVKPEISSGNLVFAGKIPPGERRLFFSYSLPVGVGSVSLTHFFPLNTRELELIKPEKTFEVSVETDSGGVQPTMISRKKKVDRYIYDSETLLLNDNPKQIRLLIKNIPLPQSKLLYPAAAGCVLIFLFLFWYLKRRDSK